VIDESSETRLVGGATIDSTGTSDRNDRYASSFAGRTVA
jgi:hypothetical protein